ncbi:MAG: tetratricopeptide repeat protein, partial [Bacillota bacterium]
MRGWVVVCSILFLVGVALEVVTLTPLRQVSWVEQLHNLSFVPIWVSLVLLWVRAEGGREELFRLVRQAADAGETLKDRIREVGALKEEIERLKRAHEALRDELHLSELFLGKLHFFERDYRKSADLLKQAVEAQPDNAECRFWLGLALLRSGDARSAIEHLDRAAQLRDDPEFL